MLQKQYVAPIFGEDFHCPHCHTFAHQDWTGITFQLKASPMDGFRASQCSKCHRYTIWYQQQLVFPFISIAPLSSDDMPEDVKLDFEEARQIVQLSPRAAVALLRLALQKLMVHLGEKGENINDDIGNLVKKGLLLGVQQALDALRVIGNNAVHPGQIDLKDDRETATALFNVLNMIVESMITYRKQVDALYNMIPEASKAAIHKRDGSNT